MVALQGTQLNFEQFAEPLGKWYSVSAYCPRKGYFATVFEDITARKKSEEALRYRLEFEEIITTINASLMKHTFTPFIKFGHAPSVYYEDNKKIKGIIMHSREQRPENLTPKVVFDGIVGCVETCEKLRITPKPEHKWPFQKTTEKHKRLIELTDVLGKQFNPFLLDCKLEELAKLVL